jgi:hypothetical protein
MCIYPKAKTKIKLDNIDMYCSTIAVMMDKTLALFKTDKIVFLNFSACLFIEQSVKYVIHRIAAF